IPSAITRSRSIAYFVTGNRWPSGSGNTYSADGDRRSGMGALGRSGSLGLSGESHRRNPRRPVANEPNGTLGDGHHARLSRNRELLGDVGSTMVVLVKSGEEMQHGNSHRVKRALIAVSPTVAARVDRERRLDVGAVEQRPQLLRRCNAIDDERVVPQPAYHVEVDHRHDAVERDRSMLDEPFRPELSELLAGKIGEDD